SIFQHMQRGDNFTETRKNATMKSTQQRVTDMLFAETQLIAGRAVIFATDFQTKEMHIGSVIKNLFLQLTQPGTVGWQRLGSRCGHLFGSFRSSRIKCRTECPDSERP